MSGYVRPSAATITDQRLNALLDELTNVTAERDRLRASRDQLRAIAADHRAAIARARAHHKQKQLVLQDGTTAGGGCAHCEYQWPCPTINALDQEPDQ